LQPGIVVLIPATYGSLEVNFEDGESDGQIGSMPDKGEIVSDKRVGGIDWQILLHFFR
jgi:hypothetical protein